MAETEPILKRVDDIPKKLDLILEQLTVLSGVEAKAPRIEKSNARKQSAEKRQKDSDAKAFKMFSKTMEENNKLLQKQLDMAAAAKKMQEKSESREKKNAKDINRKGKEVASPQLEKLQKMTLDEQQKYWELKYKMEKQKAKIEKKILNKQKGNLFKRGGKKILEGAKGASGDILGEAVSDIKPSNALMALGPVGMVAKMVLDSTGLGKKASGAMKKHIPTWLGGSKESAKNTTKQQIKNIKQQKALERKLGGSKKNYIQQSLRGQLGYKVSDTGEISLDEDYLQKKAMGKKIAPKSLAAPNTRKAISNKKMKQEAKLLQTPQKKGNPTDQQMKNSAAGRPLLWFWRKQKEDEGGAGKSKKLQIPGMGKEGGGLLGTLLPVLGLLAGGVVGLVKGIVKGIKGDKGTPKKTSKTTKKTTTKTQSKKTNQVADRNRKKFLEDPIMHDKVESSAKNKPASKKTPKTSPKGLKGKIFNLATGVGMTSGLVALTGGTMEDMGTAALTTAAFSSAQKITEKIATKVTSTVLKTALPRMIPVASMALTIIDGMDDLIKAAKDPTYEGFYFSGRLAETHSGGTKKRGYTAPMSDGGPSQQEQAFDFQHGKGAFQKMHREQALQRHKARGGTEANFIDPNEIATIAQKMDIEKSTKIVNTVVQGTQNFIGTLFQIATEGLSGVKSEEATRRSIPAGAINPNGSIPSGGGEGMYASRGWFRETQANRRAFNLANDAVEKPKKANDLLAGPKGNYTFNVRDQHYVLPDGQVLSTNRGINTLPESKGIRDGRFASTNNTSNDNTEKLLQQILSALQNGSGGSPTVINNTTRLVSPENFVTGGVFT